jgi:AraC-like DNA-binding protein
MSRDRDDFAVHAARAVRQVETGPGDVQDVRLVVDGLPFASRARFVISDGLTFVLGENAPEVDLLLQGGPDVPFVAIHTSLRGPAIVRVAEIDEPIGSAAGNLVLCASPTSRSTVDLRAGTINQGFRIAFSVAKVSQLAGRFAAVAPLAASVAAGAPFLRQCARVLDAEARVAEVMNSGHLGPARPMFLEARALEWLATLLAPASALAPARPVDRLPRRELDRIHEARDILLARSVRPPTLAELAASVGTNEFTLKRNFKRVFGRPPYAFLLAHRLDAARRMLVETEQSIKEIAAAIGYAHASHFSTAFRRQFGVTPWQQRERARRVR